MKNVLAISLLSTSALLAQEKKPNILFILTDQQNSSMLSCAGNDKLQTPAMDRIAEKGVRFTRAYCANPVSLPSRFALLTGHFASEVDVRYNEAIADKTKVGEICANGTIGTVFRNAGYTTLYGGKTHLPPANSKTVTERMNETYGFSSYFTSNERDTLAMMAADYLQNYKTTDNPFCMVVSLINPHDICFFWNDKIYDETRPTTIPWDSWNYCKSMINKRIELGEEVYTSQLPPFPVNYAQMTNAPHLDTYMSFTDRSKLDFYSWSYHRLTEAVDAEIDVVLTALENSQVSDNTIVVLTSDHGDMNGAHQLIMKSRIYDEASKIPFIFYGPGIKQNVTDTTLANNGLDLLPTLCDLAGIDAPTGLTGYSLKSQLTDVAPTPIAREYMFYETAIAFVCMDNRYKYALYDGSGITEVLIDLQNDLKETNNVAQDAAYENVHDRMHAELTAYMNLHNYVLNPNVTRMPKTDSDDGGTDSLGIISCEDLIALSKLTDSVWVKGYVVGLVHNASPYNGWMIQPTENELKISGVYQTLALADNPLETDTSKMICIKLGSTFSSLLNLRNNYSYLNKQIFVRGKVYKQYINGVRYEGMSEMYKYEWTEDNVTSLSATQTPKRELYVSNSQVIIPDVDTQIQVAIYTIEGKLLHTSETTNKTYLSPSLPKGIYYIYINENGKQQGQKIIVDK